MTRSNASNQRFKCAVNTDLLLPGHWYGVDLLLLRHHHHLTEKVSNTKKERGKRRGVFFNIINALHLAFTGLETLRMALA